MSIRESKKKSSTKEAVKYGGLVAVLNIVRMLARQNEIDLPDGLFSDIIVLLYGALMVAGRFLGKGRITDE